MYPDHDKNEYLGPVPGIPGSENSRPFLPFGQGRFCDRENFRTYFSVKFLKLFSTPLLIFQVNFYGFSSEADKQDLVYN